MMKSFSGKHVIVTGAGTGIGKATAHRFLVEGAEVLLIGRREQVLEKAVSSFEKGSERAWYLAADVSNPEDCKRSVNAAVSRWGKLDVLVNNAGVDDCVPFLEADLALWEKVMNTNLRGAFLMSQLVARVMVKQGGGVILHNASISGLGGEPNHAIYCSSKGGLIALARSMAVELAQYRIRVNCVSPGFVDRTEMTENEISPETLKELRANFDRAPLRRLASPEDIAAGFVFLASDDATYVTGQNLVVDGGLTTNLYVWETISKE